jgi:hypothetical protein
VASRASGGAFSSEHSLLEAVELAKCSDRQGAPLSPAAAKRQLPAMMAQHGSLLLAIARRNGRAWPARQALGSVRG